MPAEFKSSMPAAFNGARSMPAEFKSSMPAAFNAARSMPAAFNAARSRLSVQLDLV
jgi:hypothetical protein